MRNFRGALPFLVSVLVFGASGRAVRADDDDLDRKLSRVLKDAGFTGRVESTLEDRLGRKVDPAKADLGRLLFFDRLVGLKLDNACAGCHSPAVGFGDTQPIAIGIDNNNKVGPHRAGPRNQRRAPMVLNSAFFPRLMLNARFEADSGDPFDNSAGFTFPPPEGRLLSGQPHLLNAQAFLPPPERVEMAGFEFEGTSDDIRAEVARRLNVTPNYRQLFRRAFGLRGRDPITYDHFAAAVAEFQINLTFANAPIDRFARGTTGAMTRDEKRGALLFFGKAGCVTCHAVGGNSNEMFSDFDLHVLGVPQIAPRRSNVTFDGPGADEDFGREQVSGAPADRYKFRTSPLRNVALQPAFFHNGAFTTLEEAIAHHLDVRKSALNYTPRGRLPADLAGPTGPIRPVLDRLDPLVRRPLKLSDDEFRQLVAFVRTGLLDERARPERLVRLIPERLPSELPPLDFEIDD